MIISYFVLINFIYPSLFFFLVMWDLLPFLRKAVPHNLDIVYTYPLWSRLTLFRPKAEGSLGVIPQGEEVERMNKFSDGELLELYRQGLTNKEIAVRLGVTQPAVDYRLQKLEMVNNYHLRSDVDPNRVSILHSMGVTNVGIALILGTSVASVSVLMETLDLEDNCNRLKKLLREDNQECECGD
jgi:predicted transcriptional regulator